MGHFHGHSNDYSNTKNLRSAFFINLAFTIIEIFGGFYTNSVAIFSDALHDLGDSFSLGIAWYFQRISNKDSTKRFTYGFKRYSVMGAFVNAIVLLVGMIIVLNQTIPRLINPQPSDAPGMILLAVIGIVVNGLAVLKLKQGSSLNERVVMLHLLEDVLGWVAVLIGAIIMYFYDLPIIDPLLSLGIAVYVLINVFKNLRSVMKVILQGVPEDIDTTAISKVFKNSYYVSDFHDLHIWSLDGEFNVLSVHLVVESSFPLSELSQLKSELREELEHHNVHHATLEIDLEGVHCEFEDS